MQQYALIRNTPQFVEYTIDNSNGTMTKHKQDWAKTQSYNIGYHFWIPVIFETIIPFILLLTLNVRIFIHIYNSSKCLKDLGSSHVEDSKNEKILISIVSTFFICHIPRLVLYSMVFYINKNCFNHWAVIFPINDLSLIFNSSVNFLIYCFVLCKFREHCFVLLKVTKITNSCFK